MHETLHNSADSGVDPEVKRVPAEPWNPKVIRILWILLWGVCGCSILAEFFIHKHPHFEGTGFFGFNALLGFIACSVMIIVAKLLAFLLKRKPDYYDKDA